MTTTHVILGIYLAQESTAREILEASGVSMSLFESVLEEEPGPSPEGHIPYTVRSVMIGGLAVLEADADAFLEVNDLHLLVGAISESRRWRRQHAWGPRHLEAAAAAADTTLDHIEDRTRILLPK